MLLRPGHPILDMLLFPTDPREQIPPLLVETNLSYYQLVGLHPGYKSTRTIWDGKYTCHADEIPA